MKTVTDQELRAMRNAVYPAGTPQQVQTDEIWERVKVNWRRDEAWLVEMFNLLPAESRQPRPPQP